MNAVKPSDRLGPCAICFGDEFTSSNPAVTHVGGEAHDPFHKSCLRNWLMYNPVCPLDRMGIDRSSLVSRTDIIGLRFKTAMRNAVLAASFGTILLSIGRVWVAGQNRVETCELIARMPALVRLVAGIAGGATAAAMTLSIALVGTRVSGAAGAGVEVGCMTAAVGAMAIACSVVAGTEGEMSAGAAVTAFIGGAAAVTGAGFDAENVGSGMLVGGLVPLIVGSFFSGQYALKMSIVGVPLIAGTSAGILSLMRR